MSLALRHPEPDQPALPAPWISVLEAARRLQITPGHARRRCAEEWSAAGLAQRFGDLWGVHPGADPRLADIESRADRDRRQLAAAQRHGVKRRYLALAELRAKIVREFASFEADHPLLDRETALGAYLAEVMQWTDFGPGRRHRRRISASTFYAWRAAYERPGDDGGLAALIPRYGTTNGVDPIGAEAWQAIVDLLNSGNAVRVGAAYDIVRTRIAREQLAADPAWRLPSLRTVQQIARQRRPRPLRVLAAKGPRTFDATCIPKGERDYDAIPAGEEWVGDEHTLDIMCRVRADRGGWRMTRAIKVTAWMDVRSRGIVGWVIDEFANSDTILGSLKRGIASHGKPRVLRCDWGRDYRKATGHVHTSKRWQIDDFDGPRIAGVLDRLGIEVRPVTPYFPWAKPIERFFGTLKERFSKLFASYWGGSPAERHEQRDRFCRENLHRLPTLDEIRELFAAWIETYHNAPHGGAGTFGYTPAKILAELRDGPPRYESSDVLDVLFLSYTEPKLVRRDGVRHACAWYGWGDPRLVAMQGRRVVLGIDPADAGHALVCEDNGDRTPLFWIDCERWRFSSKRDAERIAKTRARTRREYAEPVRRGREAFLSETPAHRLARLAAAQPGPADETPGITAVRPELSAALKAAGPKPERGEPPEVGPLADAHAAGETVELDDLLDPFATAELDDDELPGVAEYDA